MTDNHYDPPPPPGSMTRSKTFMNEDIWTDFEVSAADWSKRYKTHCEKLDERNHDHMAWKLQCINLRREIEEVLMFKPHRPFIERLGVPMERMQELDGKMNLLLETRPTPAEVPSFTEN